MDRHRHGTDGNLNDHAPDHDDVNSSARGAGGHIAADNDDPRGTLAHRPTNEYHDELIDYLNNCCTNNDDNRCPNNDHDHDDDHDHHKHNDHDRHDNDRPNHHN